MKRTAIFLLALTSIRVFASDVLPFPVTVGGEAAKDGVPFAKIEKPVAANAEMSVGAKADMIIANVVAVSEKGEPVPGAQTAILLLQGTSKTTLDKTMDGKKLAPGRYLLSVTGGEKTATILFSIK